MTRTKPGAKRGRPRPDDVPLKKISLEVDPAILHKFDAWAKRQGLSRGAMVRRLMRELDYRLNAITFKIDVVTDLPGPFGYRNP